MAVATGMQECKNKVSHVGKEAKWLNSIFQIISIEVPKKLAYPRFLTGLKHF